MALSSSGLFDITTWEHIAGEFHAVLVIDQNNPLLKGHFPGQPVVPGACMVQLVKDVLEDALDARLLQKMAANIKFISMLTPASKDSINLSVTYNMRGDGCVTAHAKITAAGVVCFKMQAEYLPV